MVLEGFTRAEWDLLAHEYFCSYGVLLALEKGAGIRASDIFMRLQAQDFRRSLTLNPKPFVWVGYNLMTCHDMLPAMTKAALSI